MNKILIADDNQQITSILANYARKEGFEPLVALDGQQALELFEQHEKNIDVVLLDVMMPKLDGFEVCRSCAAVRWCRSSWSRPGAKILNGSWVWISALMIIF